ncbi:MAG: PDZ domain-containing protein, partial [Candidatus Riflebacteria bacterium]|nr:PDZ domain-containing protein [Candidatus Riflebacteria bacterium]
MASEKKKNEISLNLIAGLILFLLCFIIGLILWDWHHYEEVSKNIAHHKAMLQAEWGNSFVSPRFRPDNNYSANIYAQDQYQWSDNQTLLGRPWWGITVLPVNAKNQKQLNSPVPFGVVVTRVDSRSIVDSLCRGDVIVQVDSWLVRDDRMFWSFVKDKIRGDEVVLTVFRNGQRIALRLKLKKHTLQPIEIAAPNQANALPVALPITPDNTVPQGVPGAEVEPRTLDLPAIGIGVEELTPELAQTFTIPAWQEGLIITEAEGVAQTAGLLAGDIIQTMNNQPVKTISDLEKIL